jgi:hypothetical protein
VLARLLDPLLIATAPPRPEALAPTDNEILPERESSASPEEIDTVPEVLAPEVVPELMYTLPLSMDVDVWAREPILTALFATATNSPEYDANCNEVLDPDTPVPTRIETPPAEFLVESPDWISIEPDFCVEDVPDFTVMPPLCTLASPD